jgi:23S rRNA (guanosine2251-2'-O)-methyltransferase
MSSKKNLVIAGRKPVLEALEAGEELERVYLEATIRGEYEVTVRNLCKDLNIPLHKAQRSQLHKLTGANHQGVVAMRPVIKYQSLEELIPYWFEQGLEPVVLVLDGITDVRNFGAIARSAEAFGIQAILIPDKGSAAINDVAVKISSGALQHIPVCRNKSLANATDLLKTYGFRIMSTSLQDSLEPENVDFKGPIALIMGAEETGVSEHLLRRSDYKICIPQSGKVDSLNVSVATGIILYEIFRQRKHT